MKINVLLNRNLNNKTFICKLKIILSDKEESCNSIRLKISTDKDNRIYLYKHNYKY